MMRYILEYLLKKDVAGHDLDERGPRYDKYHRIKAKSDIAAAKAAREFLRGKEVVSKTLRREAENVPL